MDKWKETKKRLHKFSLSVPEDNELLIIIPNS